MTEDARAVAARRLRPWAGRLLVVESPVDEEQRDSGLIVPLALPDGDVIRAVVTAVSDGWFEPGVGAVVYFAKDDAHRVLDGWAVDPASILAYEDDD